MVKKMVDQIANCQRIGISRARFLTLLYVVNVVLESLQGALPIVPRSKEMGTVFDLLRPAFRRMRLKGKLRIRFRGFGCRCRIGHRGYLWVNSEGDCATPRG